MGKGTKPPAAPPDSISLHRKLDPIYECVDTGQNKAALRLIGDLLKKYPTLQIARVLKGITLSRMGREDEGMDLCEEVRAEGPADDTVLNTLALFYKNVGAAQQQVEMFERASERDPRNTEHLTLLFQAYARAYDFVKQQQCAMKLYRLTNNPKHVMWAVCAMLMQAEANPTALALAAGMCSKLEAKGSIADRESLLVYARVLRECGKGEKALELLGGALGTKCVPMAAERANLCAVQAAAFGQNGETMRHWRDLLTHAPDDWIAMSSAMDIAMPATNAAVTHRPQVPAGGTRMAPDAHVVGGVGTVKVGSSSSDLAKLLGRVALEPSNDDTGTGTSTEAALNAGRTLVDEIRAASDGLGGAFKAGRGAYLLAVEFAYRSVQSPAGSPLGSLGDAMASYWAQFGTWTSCARDLRPYCDAIVRTDPGVAKALGDKFVEEANALPEAEGGSDGKEAQRRLRRVIAAHAISAQLGTKRRVVARHRGG
jgi:N-terminal acetyltransferase B complex non-catalytic subunit